MTSPSTLLPIANAAPSMQALVGDPVQGEMGISLTQTVPIPEVRLNYPNATVSVPVTFSGGPQALTGTLSMSNPFLNGRGIVGPTMNVTIPAYQTTVVNYPVDATAWMSAGVAAAGGPAFDTGWPGVQLELTFTSGSTSLTSYFDLVEYAPYYADYIAFASPNCSQMGVAGIFTQRASGDLDAEVWFDSSYYGGNGASWSPQPSKAVLFEAYFGTTPIMKTIVADTQYTTVVSSSKAPSATALVNYDPSWYDDMRDDGVKKNTNFTYYCTLVPSSYTFPVTAPTVTAVSPYLGALGGGTVTVTGTGFDVQGATHFKFNGADATNVSCPTATSCTMTYPPGTGPASIVATTFGITGAPAAQPFFWYSPSVTSVAPASANIGDTVLVNGIGLVPGETSITFDGVPATIVACDTANSDWCQVKVPPPPATSSVVPNGGAVIAVVQATVNGTPTAPLASAFSWNPPSVSSIWETSGPISGGAPVWLTTTGLAPCTANQPVPNVVVSFGGVAAPSATCTSNPGEILVTAPPASAPGPVNVTVTSLGASSLASVTSADVFTYTQYDLVRSFAGAWSNVSYSLTLEVAAPETTATTFALSSNTPTAISVPASVTIPAGVSNITIPVAVLGAYNPQTMRPAIRATYVGGTATAVVGPPPDPTEPPPPIRHCPAGECL